jgi:AcrR family transcriptional regulator
MERTWNQPLPRGRHHLSREEVSASQRNRILMAMLEEVADRGYAATSVAHVTAKAGVSRKSFYEQFTDKQDCYYAAFDLATEFHQAGLARAARHLDATEEPIEVFRSNLRTFLNTVASSPGASRTLLVEVFAVGPEAVRRKIGRYRAFMATILAPLGLTGDDGELTFHGQVIAGAMGALMTEMVAEGRVAEVPQLCDPFVDWVAQHLDCVAADHAGGSAHT